MSVQYKYLIKKELNSNNTEKSIESTYPFGMPMPNRQYSLSSGSKYRFGFNGQEKDDEVYGEGNLNTAEFWQYDTRIGRRWNVDPIYNAFESRYSVNGGNPIYFADPFGDYKTKLGARLANLFKKGEVVKAESGDHKGEYYFSKQTKNSVDENGNVVIKAGRPDYGHKDNKLFKLTDLFISFKSSISIQGEANINYCEIGGKVKVAGAELGFEGGAGVRLIGANFNTLDKSGQIPYIGWQSSFREHDHTVDVGGGLSYIVGLSYRRKFDIKTGQWIKSDKLSYNGVVTNVDVNTYTEQTNLNWKVGGKLALIIGVDGEAKLDVDMNKFSKTLEEIGKTLKK